MRFKITVCICTKLPFNIIYKGSKQTIKAWSFVLQGESTMQVLEDLKGTHKDIISNINSIKCLQ